MSGRGRPEGYVMSEESKAKISEARKRKGDWTKEVKERISKSMKKAVKEGRVKGFAKGNGWSMGLMRCYRCGRVMGRDKFYKAHPYQCIRCDKVIQYLRNLK